MKRVVTVLLCLLCTMTAVGKESDSLLVMFWNLENFFDSVDSGTGPSDAEFSATGERYWTSRRFKAKCNAFAKTVLWEADQVGRLPDAIGVAEVENDYVMRRLAWSTALRKFGYSYVHYDSPDPRGIDVGLLYRKETLRLLSSRPCHIDGFRTRDILYTSFIMENGDTVHLAVNHHPSKYGGDGTSDRRAVAMEALKALCDSIGSSSGLKNVVAMGDFNDTPDADSFHTIDGTLVNLAMPLHIQGKGSIRYDGKWELIDMFLVSNDLSFNHMYIPEPPFLLTWDGAHSGYRPLRTYSGPRYLGGVSDHLPVCTRLLFK